MKRIYILGFVLLVSGFVRGDAGVRPTQDPLVVNSKSIAVKLENSRVRVLDATLAPGAKEKRTRILPMSSMAGGKFRNHATDGTVTEGTFRTGDVIYREPVRHSAENIGKTTLRLELVELKD